MLREPNRIDCERALICALFMKSELIEELSAILRPTDFTDQLLSQMYEVALEMFRLGTPPDALLLLNRYHHKIGFREGEIGFLANSVVDYTPTPNHARHYALQVLRRSIRMQLERIAEAAASDHATHNIDQTLADATEELHAAQQRLANAAGHVQAQTESTVVSVASEFIESLRTQEDVGIPSVLAGFDDWIGGPLTPGTLVIIGALPGNGKTLFMMQALMRAAKARHRCVFFSQEMSPEAIGERIVAMLTGITRETFEPHTASLMIADIADQLRGSDIVIRTVQPTAAAICSAMEREQRQNGTNVFCIDYLQLLKGDGKSRYEQITSLCSDIKSITSRLGVVTYLASQLNRETVKERPPIPRAQYLRDSGQIEADADVLLGLRYPRKDTSIDELARQLEDHQKPFTAESYYQVYCWKVRNRQTPIGKFECALETSPLKLVDVDDHPPTLWRNSDADGSF